MHRCTRQTRIHHVALNIGFRIGACLAMVLAFVDTARAGEPNETYRQIIAKRATPNLKDLAERAAQIKPARPQLSRSGIY